MQFRRIGAGSSKITTTETLNNIAIDVVESSLDLANIGGQVSTPQIANDAVESANLAPNAVDLAGTKVTGTLPASRIGVHTHDIADINNLQSNLDTKIEGLEDSPAGATPGTITLTDGVNPLTSRGVVKRLVAGSNVSLTDNGDVISIASSAVGGGGEANDAANLGTNANGAGVYSSKTGVTLNFRRVQAGTEITLDTATDPNAIIINNTGTTGAVINGVNLGTLAADGEAVWFDKNGTNLRYKRIRGASTRISTTSNSNSVLLDIVEANLNLSVMGGTIGAAQIASNAVTAAKIASGAVTAPKLAIGAVDLASTTVTGVAPIGRGGTGLNSLGTAGQLLQVNATATGLEYVNASTILGSSNVFTQGGNTFGAAAVIGTNDNNPVTIEANNTPELTIRPGGAANLRDLHFLGNNATNPAIGFNANPLGGWKYSSNGTAFLFDKSPSGSMALYTAPSGTAGSTINWAGTELLTFTTAHLVVNNGKDIIMRGIGSDAGDLVFQDSGAGEIARIYSTFSGPNTNRIILGRVGGVDALTAFVQNGDVSISRDLYVNGAVRASTGATAPNNPSRRGYVFQGDSDSGLFNPVDGQLQLGVNGQSRILMFQDKTYLGGGGVNINDGAPATVENGDIWRQSGYNLYAHQAGRTARWPQVIRLNNLDINTGQGGGVSGLQEMGRFTHFMYADDFMRGSVIKFDVGSHFRDADGVNSNFTYRLIVRRNGADLGVFDVSGNFSTTNGDHNGNAEITINYLGYLVGAHRYSVTSTNHNGGPGTGSANTFFSRQNLSTTAFATGDTVEHILIIQYSLNGGAVFASGRGTFLS